MSARRLQTFGIPAQERRVIARAMDYADGAHEAAHSHLRAQLVFATRGVMRVATTSGAWMLAPGQALLVGSGVEHELHMVGPVSMRTLYIAPEALAPEAVTGECRLIAVDELLRAAILGMSDPSLDEAGDLRDALLEPLLLRLIARAPDGGGQVRVPLPAHPRLRHICDALFREPANNDTLEQWAGALGISARTVARLFRQETGLSFGQWREQLRLADAMSRLSLGHPVKRIADALGYTDARSFATMFRRAIGLTPQQFQQGQVGRD